MSTSKNEETVKVMVRIRPMSKAEKDKGNKITVNLIGCTTVVRTDAATRSVLIDKFEGAQKTLKQFSYD